MKGGGSLCMATYSLASWRGNDQHESREALDGLIRTLLLAALDAIVVVEVLLVAGRWVEGMVSSEWADGVVRYQGGWCVRHNRDTITQQAHRTTSH